MTKISVTDKLSNTSRGSYFENISWWDAKKMNSSHFLIIGAGALGNEVLKNLALLDVGKITVTDFDEIEFHNLTRSVLFRESDIGRNKADVAAEQIRSINPDVDITAMQADVIYEMGLGLFRDADVVICCVDNRLARLFINRYSFLFGKVWINGAIENLMGRLEVYSREKHCYESNLTEQEWQNIRFRLGCADVARRSETMGRIPTTPVSASIIGAWQVQEALKVVHGYQKQLADEESLFIEGLSNTILQLKNPLPKETMSSAYADEVLTVDADHTISVQELFKILEKDMNFESPTLLLRHEIVQKAMSKTTETLLEGAIPSYKLSETFEEQHPNTMGEDYYVLEQSNRIDSHFYSPKSTLKELGVPDWDVLTIINKGESKYLELKKVIAK